MASADTISGQHYEIMKRCYNEKAKMYKDYGAKGITVCEEWKDRELFRKWCISNGWNKELRVLRYDTSKGYYPENCYLGKSKKIRKGDGVAKNLLRRSEENKRIKKELGVTKYNDHPLKLTYVSMHTRCENKNHKKYNCYGGRGIYVCEEWSGNDGFKNFIRWANQFENIYDKTLDRIDVNGNYEPSNCRWATSKEQARNKRSSLMYDYHGKKVDLAEISEIENIKYGLLYHRVRLNGMDIQEAINDIRAKEQRKNIDVM